MILIIGTLLGAFLFLSGYYNWLYVSHWAALWFDLNLKIHSPASFRRWVKVWKINSLIILVGCVIGHGITDGLLQLLSR